MPKIVQLVQRDDFDENLILTERAIISSDTVYNINSGEIYSLIDNFETSIYSVSIESCSRVPNSDQMMINVRENHDLKVYVIDEPSSRSQNPMGHGVLGLPNVKNLINISQDLFLV